MREFTVYKMRLAGYLMFRGNVLLRIEPSNKHQNKNVFVFKDTAKLKQGISEYHNIKAEM